MSRWAPAASRSKGSTKFVPLPECEIISRVPADEMWQAAHQQIVDELNRDCRDAIRRRKEKNAGTVLSGTRITFGPESYEARVVYMPVFLGVYEFSGTEYRFVVNGQNGSVSGDRPWAGLVGTARKAWNWLTGSK